MDKFELLKKIIEALEAEEHALIHAAMSAKTAATEVEAKPENKYDTRGLEQAYLASGQAQRAIDLKVSIQNLKQITARACKRTSTIDLLTVVELQDDDGEKKSYFILPERGGIAIKHDGALIHTISVDSPMAQTLMGKSEGDSIELKIKAGARSFQIAKCF